MIVLGVFSLLPACAPTVGQPGGCSPGVLTIVAGVPGLSGRGADGLPATETWLSLPQDVAPGPEGGFFVADYNNHLVREIGRDGTARIVLGSGFPAGGDGGPALEEPLDHPTMILLDPFDPDLLWVAATGNHRIGRLERAAGVVGFPYGTGLPAFGGDGGPAGEASFWRPTSVAFDDAGTMYVSDRMNQVVRAIATDGTITTVAGAPGVEGDAGDGGPAVEATLSAPAATETDPGNRLDVRGTRLVFADTGNHRIREIDLETGIVRALAGEGTPGFLDGPAETARFADPKDVAIAPDGTVFVADAGNACVRAVSPEGEVRTVAGICGLAGPATPVAEPRSTTLGFPAGVASANDGTLWIADRDNHVVPAMCLPSATPPD